MFTGNTRNNQDIFDYFIEQFVVNGAPKCTNFNDTMCSYSPIGDDQIGCAIGCVLPKDTQSQWEYIGHTINGMMKYQHDMYLKVFDDAQLPFLAAMQTIHDHWDMSNENYLTEVLPKVAEDHNLTLPESLTTI